ncbi:hypothetical protein CIB95_12535 [Lottiidibacillus patelloidae]|uniref:CRISPR system ring nuclease SSO1393-like domain-containing protein n=1 Tax=Lottiidibacillus patelloidae TaxID=2670334 RepID=A0A263BRC9_9BACI|nr:histidine phosphatase family protein [Lottiidibacillus patelloidae]OZM56244.1 hypothetical protein CIB95_12535 [Lottiidibacillus patelloidae]
MKTSLIATVGNSLLKELPINGIHIYQNNLKKVVEMIKTEKYNQINEVSTIKLSLDNDLLNEKTDLYLMLPDTKEGKLTGEILKLYFKNEFQNIHTITIDGLNEENISEYKNEGLRNLFQNTSQIVYMKQKKGEECIINASGGDLIVSSFMGTIGQLLKVPVYYSIESENILPIPKLPIAMDYSLWLKHFAIFDRIYRKGSIPAEVLQKDIDSEEIIDFLNEYGGQYRLTSVGLLIHETLLKRFNDEASLYLPKRDSQSSNTQLSFPIEELPLSFITDLQSMITLKYVTNIELIEKKEKMPSNIRFKPINIQEGIIEGFFSDGVHTWIYHIKTTANDIIKLNAACVDLQLRFSPTIETPKPGTVEFILIRHGQHNGEKENRIEGWADFDLTDYGRNQSLTLANKLRQNYNINAIYSSSLNRARQTAEIIGKELNIEATTMDDLRAIDYGLAGGLTKQEAKVRYPNSADVDFPSNKQWGRESQFEFSNRVIEAFYEIYYSHPGQTVAIVTHGRAIGAILKEVLHLPVGEDFRVEADDTSIHHFVMGPDRIIVRSLNNSEHLINLQMQVSKEKR